MTHPRTVWPEDPIFIEFGVHDADVASGLRHAGYSKYLGVSSDKRRIAHLHASHPELADSLTFSKRRKLVLHNNAEVLILSGVQALHWWKFRTVRHAQSVAWRLSFNPVCLLALLGCIFHAFHKRCSWPRFIALRAPGKWTRWLLVSKILKYRLCHRESLHFIPHKIGLAGLFRHFDAKRVRYIVLRWFEELPEIEPSQDVDMLVEDRSISNVLSLLHSLPGIQPCDIYSETGMARSSFRAVPYYPPAVAGRMLDGAVRHKNFCLAPNPSDYFHSLAYHAVYHKGARSGLPCASPDIKPEAAPGHDYAGILRGMAAELGIQAEISLDGLHAYLIEHHWGPAPDLLGRLASAWQENRWLQILAQQLPAEMRDQGLAVFILRREAVRRGFQAKMINMIQQSGFEILATKTLSPAEVDLATARTRGGDWISGDFALPGGPPAIAVVAYDRSPIAATRKQQHKYPQRYNARLFVKDTIRDTIAAELSSDQVCNALHSSDHAAEAWHLIEEMAPELLPQIRARLRQLVDNGTQWILPATQPPSDSKAMHSRRRAA